LQFCYHLDPDLARGLLGQIVTEREQCAHICDVFCSLAAAKQIRRETAELESYYANPEAVPILETAVAPAGG
jgi:hypothetical protein